MAQVSSGGNDHTGRAAGAGASGTRCIALVGPFGSGKTTLLEAILKRTGAIARQGSAGEGNMVGDAGPEARSHGMSVETNFAETDFMGDRFSFADCPGSVEFLAEMEHVIARQSGREVGDNLDENLVSRCV